MTQGFRSKATSGEAMKGNSFASVVVCVAASVALAGCSAILPQSGRQWASCGRGAAVGGLGGAAAGAAIGALANGGKGAATGALIGAGVGLLAGCAIAKELTARDEAELAAAEKRAAESGSAASASWTNEQGKERSYQVAVEPVASTGDRLCRRTRGKLDAGQDGYGETTQVYCRTDSGDWEPIEETA